MSNATKKAQGAAEASAWTMRPSLCACPCTCLLTYQTLQRTCVCVWAMEWSLSGGEDSVVVTSLAAFESVTPACMCVRGFYSTQAGMRAHTVDLQLLAPGWNIVSFRALDGLGSFNLIYIFYPSPVAPSPQALSPRARWFVAAMDEAAAATCPASPQQLSAAASPTSASSSSSSPPPLSISITESHCIFRCPVPRGLSGQGGEGRALLAITVRNGWAYTQVTMLWARAVSLTSLHFAYVDYGRRLHLLPCTAIPTPSISSSSVTAAMM